jgi:hypothetical protein
MSDELNNIENTVHEYRKTLDSFAARTGAKTHHVEIRGSGEEREKIARIDADLDAVERMNQDRVALRAAQERLKQLEEERSQPQFRGVVARADVKHDLASPEYAKRWLHAVARGDAAEMRALATSTSCARSVQCLRSTRSARLPSKALSQQRRSLRKPVRLPQPIPDSERRFPWCRTSTCALRRCRKSSSKTRSAKVASAADSIGLQAASAFRWR